MAKSKLSTKPAPGIILVRHGETNFNDHGHEKLRGWLDIPLNSDGKNQAKKAADILSGLPTCMVVSSGLQRTSDTAKEISKKLSAPHIIDNRVASWNVGKLAGMFLKDAKPVIQHALDNPDIPLPGGESFNQFVTRWKAGLVDTAKRSEKSGKPAIVVTSHSNILSMPAVLYGKEPGTVTDGPPLPGDVVRVPIPAHLLTRQIV